MHRKLQSQERINLQRRHKKERDKRICDRIKAVLLYDKGYSYSETAEILLLDDETIRRHVQDYFSNNKLAPENGGSSTQLSVTESKQLIKHLKNETYRHVKCICAYVKNRFGLIYSISGMTNWLKAQGFRYKKPNPVPAKSNQEMQESFINEYEALKKKAAKKEPIYFIDSVHPEHQTRLAHGWIMKGERKNIKTTAKQFRVNIMGAICLNGHKVIYDQTDKVNEASIMHFLYKLRKHHEGKYFVHLILDNAGYHHSKRVQDFAKELGIQLHYLPPYSPNLNPIERLWKIMHEHVTYNRYYEKFSDFTEAIKYFFRHIGKKKALLKARINDSFQKTRLPNFAS